jgi:hypothetical protein
MEIIEMFSFSWASSQNVPEQVAKRKLFKDK